MNVGELFLSHSSTDSDFVTPLAETIRAHGVPVWISSSNLLGAQKWHDEIGAALARCDWFAIVLTPNSVSSRWVKHELSYALNKDQYSDKIVPVLRTGCDFEKLSWTLGAFQMVKFTISNEQGMTDLLKIWGIGFDLGKSKF